VATNTSGLQRQKPPHIIGAAQPPGRRSWHPSAVLPWLCACGPTAARRWTTSSRGPKRSRLLGSRRLLCFAASHSNRSGCSIHSGRRRRYYQLAHGKRPHHVVNARFSPRRGRLVIPDPRDVQRRPDEHGPAGDSKLAGVTGSDRGQSAQPVRRCAATDQGSTRPWPAGARPPLPPPPLSSGRAGAGRATGHVIVYAMCTALRRAYEPDGRIVYRYARARGSLPTVVVAQRVRTVRARDHLAEKLQGDGPNSANRRSEQARNAVDVRRH